MLLILLIIINLLNYPLFVIILLLTVANCDVIIIDFYLFIYYEESQRDVAKPAYLHL